MKRDISGILLLDKPIGPSSNEALQIVKRLFGAKKAGHTGSLDPIASGMLPICFGEATKFTQFLLNANKRYLVTGKLGEATASGDSETPALSQRSYEGITAAKIEAALAGFRGRIAQTPPMYSAIKHQGQPLYKLARQGIEVERQVREVDVFSLNLLEWREPFFQLDLSCSKGTYVRTIVADLGEVLGCGAHVVSLRRTEVEPYHEGMLSLSQLEAMSQAGLYSKMDEVLLPIESILVGLPVVSFTPEMLYYAKRGNPIFVPRVSLAEHSLVRINDKLGKFSGVGKVLEDGKIAPQRLCV